MDGCDLLPNLPDVCDARSARLNAAPLAWVMDVEHDAHLHDICGIVAKRRPRQFEKAANGSARSGHEKKRERNFRTPDIPRLGNVRFQAVDGEDVPEIGMETRCAGEAGKASPMSGGGQTAKRSRNRVPGKTVAV